MLLKIVGHTVALYVYLAIANIAHLKHSPQAGVKVQPLCRVADTRSAMKDLKDMHKPNNAKIVVAMPIK